MKEMSERRFREKLEALNMHAKEVASAGTPQDVAEHTLRIVKTVLGYDLGTFGFVEGDDVTFVASTGFVGFKPLTMSLRGPGITVRAVRTGETQLVPEVENDPQYVGALGKALGIRLHSELDVPVKVDGDVVAVINLEAEQPNSFTENDRLLLEVFSQHVSSALQRIRQLEKLRESEERYRTLVENSQNAISVTVEGTIVYANKRRAELAGKDDPSELVGTSALSQMAEEDRESIVKRMEARKRGDKLPLKYEFRMLRADGSVRDIVGYSSEINYQGNNAVQHVLHDVTEQKRYEIMLEALHSHASDLSKAETVEEIAEETLDCVERVIGFNVGSFSVVEGDMLRHINIIGVEAIGVFEIPLDGRGVTVRAVRTSETQLVPDCREDEDFEPGLAAGIFESMSELAVPVKVSGNVVAVINVESTRLDAFTENDRKVLEILATHVASAFSQIKAREQLIAEQAEKTKELLDGINRMASMVRHDTKGPLQTIRNATYLLREQSERAPEIADMIDQSVDYAMKILDDLKSPMSPAELQRNLVNINDLVEQSLSSISFPSNIRVEKHFSDEFLALTLDSAKMRRVFDNLIKNAVEAMPEGGALMTDVSRDRDVVRITIRDTGVGIPKRDMPILFSPFYTKRGGAGLSLVFCKQVVEAHGGTIEATSTPRKETKFKIALQIN